MGLDVDSSKKIQAPPKCLDKQTDVESGIVGALC
jgi:hypothetical protein